MKTQVRRSVFVGDGRIIFQQGKLYTRGTEAAHEKRGTKTPTTLSMVEPTG
jgi:hypothetical protein